MGYLCKYLVKAGWEPQVLTEASADKSFTFLSAYCLARRWAYYPAGKRLWSKLRRAVRFLLDLLFHEKERLFYKEACRLLEKQPFDLLLCSACRDFPLTATAKAARHHHLPWVADLRDIIEQYGGNEYIGHRLPPFVAKLTVPLFRRRSLARRNRALRKAAALTTVSPWHRQWLKQWNPNVHLIYNGYDPELFFPEPKASKQFLITYTGRVQSLSLRDPSLLFDALANLTREGRINPGDCRLRWYTDAASQALIEAEAAKAGVTAYMDYAGYVAASEIPAVLNESSVLLLLANKAGEGGPRGIMTTKLFEFLAVGKPILCVRSDESYLADIIRQEKAGLAATDSAEVERFLLYHYGQWKQTGDTSLSSPAPLPEIYSRAGQAEQFMRLFLELSD